jgi:hypothetical protein
MFGALHFHAAGFVGTIVITEGSDTITVTPNKTDSVWRVLDALATAATAGASSTYTFSVSNAGVVSIASTGTFNLTTTAENAALCKFSGTSFSSVSSVTSTAAPASSFTPYTDGDGILFLGNLRVPQDQGVQTFDGGYWLNCGATSLKFPSLSFSCLRPVLETFLDVTQIVGTPAKVDLIVDGSPSSFFLGAIRVSEQDAIDGWSRVTLEICQ